ncbi:hypothetical protein [Pedobacter aquatilis]|uniref:hypothetical protein n=1 Tax=Pedobacter aquatilis TaxID=351343 RepID=UPI00292F4C48|nr:hypothetical protein [Pedobacter aquatilis]
MKDMISIFKESALSDNILDVIEVAPHTLNIILNDDANVKQIVKQVNEVDSQFWSTREPIQINYIYQDGSSAQL